MKNYIQEKRALFDELKKFITSPELAAIKDSVNALQKKIDKIPDREMKSFDNFTILAVAFFNMMGWCHDFNWNRQMEKFNELFEKENARRELLKMF